MRATLPATPNRDAAARQERKDAKSPYEAVEFDRIDHRAGIAAKLVAAERVKTLAEALTLVSIRRDPIGFGRIRDLAEATDA